MFKLKEHAQNTNLYESMTQSHPFCCGGVGVHTYRVSQKHL